MQRSSAPASSSSCSGLFIFQNFLKSCVPKRLCGFLLVSIPLHMGTDAVRDDFLLAMIVVAVTMFICSVAYEVVMRIAPWMVGKKKKKTL